MLPLEIPEGNDTLYLKRHGDRLPTVCRISPRDIVILTGLENKNRVVLQRFSERCQYYIGLAKQES